MTPKGILVLSLVLMASALSATQLKEKVGSYEKKGNVYAVGETVHLVSSRQQAELKALKDAVDKLAELLEKKGLGTKKDIALGVENAVTKETELTAYNFGKVRIDSVYQERWEAPDGKEAWSVKVKISVRRR